MSDRSNAAMDQRQIDSRTNLFYLLQTLADHAQARAIERESCVEASITNNQIEMQVCQKELLH